MISEAVDGTNGTIAFGGGMPALQGEIEISEDGSYLVVEGKPVGATLPGLFLVPVAAIKYVRIDRPREES